MRWRVAQISDFLTDWRWATLLSVAALAGLVVSVLAARRRPQIAQMPLSLLGGMRQTDAVDVDQPKRGPRGGRVVRRDDAPPDVPNGRVVLADHRPSPPLADHSTPNVPPMPPAEEPAITIDLTKLESGRSESPVVVLRDRVIDLRVDEQRVVLPADPWG